jgi:C_GCAxxG_C_C family probable redox protein
MKPTPVEKAAALQGQGFGCAQSVLSAFAPQYGLDEKIALKMASPLGGGVARHGDVCGAVTGALLVLGLARGADTTAGKEEVYRLSQVFLRQFEARHGTLLCRALIGFDLNTPEGLQKARESGKFTTICPVLVRDAAELIQSFLETTG